MLQAFAPPGVAIAWLRRDRALSFPPFPPLQSMEVLDLVDAAFSPSKRPKEVSRLWSNSRERTTWQADLRQARTAARLAYCAALLSQQATPLLALLHRRVEDKAYQGKKKEAGGKESKVVVAPKEAKKEKAKAKRGRVEPPPENMRVTRARAL
jgi:hypothetical protein